YRVVARVGQDEIAMIPGSEIARYLMELPLDARKLQIERRVRLIIESLADSDRKAAGLILSALAEKDPGELPGARPLKNSRGVFAIDISADLSLLARRIEGTNHVEVMDVLRSEILKGVTADQDAAEAKE